MHLKLPVNDLIRVAHAGAGFSVSAGGYQVDDLIRIAHVGPGAVEIA